MRLWCCLQNGLTALMFAAFYGHDAVVKTLLDKGADTTDTSKVRFSLVQKNRVAESISGVHDYSGT